MAKRYIITLMASNRVGILAALTNALGELGGDLSEVSQTVLQKFFTIILAADFPEHRDPKVIADHIRGLCQPFNIEVTLRDPSVEQLQPDMEPGDERYFLTATGEDQRGIIREISTRLALAGIDITDLYARRNDQEKQFAMVMELDVPTGVDILSLQNELEELGHTGGLTVAVQHENIFAATNDPRPVRVALAAVHARALALDAPPAAG